MSAAPGARSIKGLCTARSLRSSLCQPRIAPAASSCELALSAAVVEILAAQVNAQPAGAALDPDRREGLDATTTASVVPQHVVADAGQRAEFVQHAGRQINEFASHACIVASAPVSYKKRGEAAGPPAALPPWQLSTLSNPPLAGGFFFATARKKFLTTRGAIATLRFVFCRDSTRKTLKPLPENTLWLK